MTDSPLRVVANISQNSRVVVVESGEGTYNLHFREDAGIGPGEGSIIMTYTSGDVRDLIGRRFFGVRREPVHDLQLSYRAAWERLYDGLQDGSVWLEDRYKLMALAALKEALAVREPAPQAPAPAQPVA